jgi:hypothetical protein
MTTEPTIEGVEKKYIVECDGEPGKFYIASIGSMPEREFGFYYRDDVYEFCFYADQIWDGRKFDIDVKDATRFRFTGASPKINPSDYDRIARNMAKFFATRSFLLPHRPIPSTEEFRRLRLSWKLI